MDHALLYAQLVTHLQPCKHTSCCVAGDARPKRKEAYSKGKYNGFVTCSSLPRDFEPISVHTHAGHTPSSKRQKRGDSRGKSGAHGQCYYTILLQGGALATTLLHSQVVEVLRGPMGVMARAY